VFQRLAREIDGGTLTSLSALRERLRGSKLSSDGRVRQMLKLCDQGKEANAMGMALLTYKTEKETVFDTLCKLVVSHVVERERRRLAYSGDNVAYFSEKGVLASSVARVVKARFPVQELAMREERHKTMFAHTNTLSYGVFLDLSRVHNVDYRHDPPVMSFMGTMAHLRDAGLPLEATLCPGLAMALGRSLELHAWVKSHASLLPRSFSHTAVYEIKELLRTTEPPVRLGDGSSTETRLGTSSSGYFRSRLTETIEEICDDAEHFTHMVEGAQHSGDLYVAMHAYRGLNDFRANHVAL